VFSIHARRRLESRGVAHWQVVAGVAAGVVLEERPDDLSNPPVVVRELLVDGTEIEAICSYLPENDAAQLVTVYLPGSRSRGTGN